MVLNNHSQQIIFKGQSLDDLDRLDKIVLRRIIKKLKWFAKQPDPLKFAANLTNPQIGQYRFRIGDYRVIFDYQDKTIIILRIGHRNSIYK